MMYRGSVVWPEVARATAQAPFKNFGIARKEDGLSGDGSYDGEAVGVGDRVSRLDPRSSQNPLRGHVIKGD